MAGEKSGERMWRRAYARLPEALRAGLDPVVERRRWLLLGLPALLALGLFVAAPGYVASQPGFLQRYASLQEHNRSWAASTHAGTPCQSCHVAPERLAQYGYSVRMLGEFYASIALPQRQPDLFGTPENAACEQCHRDIRQASPSGDLKIPHRAHVEVLELDCVHCHSYVVHNTNPEGTHSPRMTTCLECHDGRKAKRDCAACHEWKDAPANHRESTWLIEHPSKQDEIDCTGCHAWTQDWCSECHSSRPASHTGKWRSTHRDAIEERRNCETCHREDFCVRCHGELPSRNLDPTMKYVQ